MSQLPIIFVLQHRKVVFLDPYPKYRRRLFMETEVGIETGNSPLEGFRSFLFWDFRRSDTATISQKVQEKGVR